MQLSKTVSAFLNAQPIGHLATVDKQSAPHVVPVCFAVVDDAIFIAIDAKPKSTQRLQRLRNIERNPQVALVVDVYDADWSRLRWVMLRGPAEISCASEVRHAISALCDKYPQYRSMNLHESAFICLRPERINEWAATPAQWPVHAVM
jgi:PPOX class probable F420-dependent enzyme